MGRSRSRSPSRSRVRNSSRERERERNPIRDRTDRHSERCQDRRDRRRESPIGRRRTSLDRDDSRDRVRNRRRSRSRSPRERRDEGHFRDRERSSYRPRDYDEGRGDRDRGGSHRGDYDGRNRHDAELTNDAREPSRRVEGYRYANPEPPQPPRKQLSDDPPPVGTIHQATVKRIQPYGIFVELDGFSRHGLVHNSQVDDMLSFQREDNDQDKVKAMEWACPPGKIVKVKVVEVRTDDAGRMRLGCSIKVVNQDTGKDMDPRNEQVSLWGVGPQAGGHAAGPRSDAPPAEGSILRAQVKQIRGFGVFVEMQGYKRWGLVHLSQLSDHIEFNREDTDEQKIEGMKGVVGEGETVWVKVVEVREDGDGRMRISCSIKLVNQRDGTDLDPNGLQYQPRPEGGGSGSNRKAVGANAGETAKGKVDWGHHAGDVKQMGGSVNYEMISDDEDVDVRGEHASALAESEVPPASNLAPSRALGRGRGSIMPSWMTHGNVQAPGSSAPEEETEKGPVISSVEEAMAILRNSEKKKSKKSKKDKKEKKEKKGKKKNSKREKKQKHAKKDLGSGSDSSSESA